MKPRLLLFAVLLFHFTAFSQVKEASTQSAKLLTPVGATLSVSQSDHGKYSFGYLNAMGDKTDFRYIIFKNKKEAKDFIVNIAKALKAKDGVSSLFTYTNYKIRLLTEIGGVFMIVNEAGKSQSTFRITKENYDQVNILL
jgi:hypothetical protein